MTTKPAHSLTTADRNVFGEPVTFVRNLDNYGLTQVRFAHAEIVTFDQHAPVAVRANNE